MKAIHGGDIYRNQVKLDFSVNVNPLGMPGEVEAALHGAVARCGEYPDITAENLVNAVSESQQVPKEWLLFGNGASELFMAAVHAIRPKKILIPVPSFFGYEYAAGAVQGEIIYYQTREEDSFWLTDTFLEKLALDVDMVFLANPNNPTGGLLSKEYLYKVLSLCREKKIYVVLDECFIDFCGKEYSVLSEIAQYENLILVRAYTKIFAIPGVRLGYLVCSNEELSAQIKRQLPEWNLSTFAQAAGCACAGQEAFIQRTVEYVRVERKYLSEQLKRIGLQVYPTEADFLFIYSEYPLYEKLLAQGILIRSCENFKGLGKGFYRIAVKSHKENEILINKLEEIVNGKLISLL